ncbi:integrase, catalytic region, zinc finger, CCHC-type containing protein [Tanacetum coccineum]
MIEENGVNRTKKYAKLSATEKLQADYHMKTINIILQGTRANTSGIGWNYSGQQRIVKCFNCQRDGHMEKQCPKPKRKRDDMWFRENVLLVEAQGNGKVLTEEELEFLADPFVKERWF